jgi:hypothetical protein
MKASTLSISSAVEQRLQEVQQPQQPQQAGHVHSQLHLTHLQQHARNYSVSEVGSRSSSGT